MQHQLGLRISRRIYRDGLALALDGVEGMSVVMATESWGDLFRLVRVHPVTCVVVDVRADDAAASHAIAALREVDRELRIVVLHELDALALYRLRRVGADAFADLRDGISGIVHAVEGTQPEGGCRQPPQYDADTRVIAPSLTPREREVLELVSSGLTSRVISTHLGVSPKTVENHKQRIFHKLGVQNQGHAVAIAIRSGIIAAVANDVIEVPDVIDLRDPADATAVG